MAFELAKSSLKEIQIYSGDLLMHEFLLLTWLQGRTALLWQAAAGLNKKEPSCAQEVVAG